MKKIRKNNSESLVKDIFLFTVPDIDSASYLYEAINIPIAYWTISQIEPKLVVQIGASQVVYNAFCQAINKNKMGCLAYLIDEWKGNADLGYYGDDVFEAAFQNNQDFYSPFSKLIRTDSGSAIEFFEDGTIDLLYIDLFYCDHRFDFQKWLEKLKPSGILLISGIINQASKKIPQWSSYVSVKHSFSFLQGEGVGIFLMGDTCNEKISFLFDSSVVLAKNAFTSHFSFLASKIRTGLELKIVNQKLKKLFTRLDKTYVKLEKAEKEAAGQSIDNNKMKQSIANLSSENDKLKQDISLLAHDKDILKNSIVLLEKENHRFLSLQDELLQKKEDSDNLNKSIQVFTDQLILQENKFNQFVVEEGDKYSRLQKVLETIITSEHFQQNKNNELHENVQLLFHQLTLLSDRLNQLLDEEKIKYLKLEEKLETIIVSEVENQNDNNELRDNIQLLSERLELHINGFDLFAKDEKNNRKRHEEKLEIIIANSERKQEKMIEQLIKKIFDYQTLQEQIRDSLPRVFSKLDSINLKEESLQETLTQTINLKINSLQNEIYKWGVEIQSIKDQVTQKLIYENNKMNVELLNLKNQAKDNAAIKNSLSWRITKPLRFFSKSLKRAVRRLLNKNDIHDFETDCLIIDKSNLFDKSWYLDTYKDVALAGDAPIMHYLMHGEKEGRKPNKQFDAETYYFYNPDVLADGVNAFVHYVKFGRYESRKPYTGINFFNDTLPNPSNIKGDNILIAKHIVSKAENINEGIIPITIPASTQPIVSIVIPVYNNFQLTYNCIKSIIESTTDIEYEIILGDDVSTDETINATKYIKNSIHIRNHNNLGFLLNCNEAAKHAKGEYILFLNNDVIVKKNFLERMIDVYHIKNDAGIIGAKILNMDETLQDAGWVINTEGWGIPLGRGSTPNLPEYNYLREVDCVLGACLLIRKNLFFELGLFNEIYVPAFYEEFDLCFSVRHTDLKVYYQPLAEIYHLGSATFGNDGRDQLSGRNKERFMKRWASAVEKLNEKRGDNKLLRYSNSQTKVIVFIDDKLPDFDKHAGSLTTIQYLTLLSDLNYKIIFIPDDLRKVDKYYNELINKGIEVITGNFSFKEWIKENGRYIEIFWLSRPDVSIKYIDLIKIYSSARIVYYTHDLHFLREERKYLLSKDESVKKEAQRIKPIELHIFSKSTYVLSPSIIETQIINKLSALNNARTILPYFYDYNKWNAVSSDDFYKRKNIIFLGGYGHLPNVDAVMWFVKEIWPSIFSKFPDHKFVIVGSNPPAELINLKEPGVKCIGYVENLSEIFKTARMLVAPLRYGAGVKGKIIAALQEGIPVVSSSIGIEGILLEENKDYFKADTAEDFSKKCIELLENPGICENFSRNGLNFIISHYNIDVAKGEILNIIEQIKTKTLSLNTEESVDHTCGYCGYKIVLKKEGYNSTNFRENQFCKKCGALVRQHFLAKIFIEQYNLKKDCIENNIDQINKLKIWEASHGGPFYRLFEDSKNFIFSEYFEDLKSGEFNDDGILCQNIQETSFPNNYFDVVITQEVMEHVVDWKEAFREIHRILKNKGIHIFTTPYNPWRQKTETRLQVEKDKKIFLKKENYHRDPLRQEGTLCISDFGREIITYQEEIGFEVFLYEYHFFNEKGGYVPVFVAKKR